MRPMSVEAAGCKRGVQQTAQRVKGMLHPCCLTLYLFIVAHSRVPSLVTWWRPQTNKAQLDSHPLCHFSVRSWGGWKPRLPLAWVSPRAPLCLLMVTTSSPRGWWFPRRAAAGWWPSVSPSAACWPPSPPPTHHSFPVRLAAPYFS